MHANQSSITDKIASLIMSSARRRAHSGLRSVGYHCWYDSLYGGTSCPAPNTTAPAASRPKSALVHHGC